MRNPCTHFASFSAFAISFGCFAGCNPNYEARVYDAPKVESQFVRQPSTNPEVPVRRPGPMMGKSAIPLQDRRILAAAIPEGSVVFFLKSTDTIERLNRVQANFRSVVERFAIDLPNQKLLFDLPEGWSVRWRENDIAKAELNINMGSEKPVMFTITDLSKPEDQKGWEQYLLSNINRWREQLSLAPIDFATLDQQLPKIEREGASLPSYIFDNTGANSPTSGQSAEPAAPAGNTSVTPGPSGPAAQPIAPPIANQSPVKLVYDKPETWELLPARDFRLASFKILSEGGGEVVVSMAKDSPLQNAKMWSEQILQSDDEAKIDELANKVLAEAEDISAGDRPGKLVSIRASDEPTSSTLIIASIPTGENEICLFVKMKSELKTSEIEKANLIRFINSIRWE